MRTTAWTRLNRLEEAVDDLDDLDAHAEGKVHEVPAHSVVSVQSEEPWHGRAWVDVGGR